MNPGPLHYEHYSLPTELLKQDENLALHANPYRNWEAFVVLHITTITLL